MPKTPITRVLSAQMRGWEKGSSGSKSVSIVIAFLMMVVVVLGGTMLSDTNYSSSAYDHRTRSAEGWSEDVRISYNSTADQEPAIAVEGEVVHIVWRSTWFGGQIFYTRSNDAGENWNEPVMIGPLEYGCLRPDIAVNGDDVHVVWDNNNASAREIRYLRSVDGGDTWFTERMISSDDGNNSLGPKIAVSEDGMDVHVVWVDSRHDDGSLPPRTELYYNRSTDGGVTWEGEVRLTDAPHGSSGPNIAVFGSTVHVVWGDNRDGIFDVYYRRSVNNGTTWEDEVVLADSSNWDVGPDVAVWDGHVHVVWEEDISSDEDIILYRRSTNNGETWDEPQTPTGSSVRAVRPRLAVLEDELHLVWFDGRDGGNEIYYKYSGNGGISWGEDTQLTYTDNSDSLRPNIAVDNDIIHVVWHDDRDGIWEVYYKRNPDFVNVPEFNNLFIPVISTVMIYICLSYHIRKNKKQYGGKKHENE